MVLRRLIYGVFMVCQQKKNSKTHFLCIFLFFSIKIHNFAKKSHNDKQSSGNDEVSIFA